MERKKGKKRLMKKLRSRFRLTVLNENTFEEQFSYSLTPMNVIIMFGGLLLVFGSLIYLLVAFTPLKAYVIPDFTDYTYREDARRARIEVDSLLGVIQQQERYLSDLGYVLRGETPPDVSDTTSRQATEADLNYAISEEDSLLRQQVAYQDRYELEAESTREVGKAMVLLMKPVNGTVSNAFNAREGHYGVDLIAQENEPVKAVLDGTVILSSFTADGGNVIQIQHTNNLVSVYKHNSALLKKEGDYVKAGQSIAFIGNSGDHSEGPHLHFEIWQNGVPADPEAFMSFGK
ncbi:MAG: M23 family metallopeptidase [Flavobacteriales bacterium]|jgi:murein DD-endopeptidase MepM/ murein hydrolase activator NlpD